ncbi:hemerythrin [Aquincola sp. S2]|uniref:Hemerythrin n=1 Tax=Pseudaquabacterium terrae TaxID=2732868 RepID=A0ABX2ESG1_9BURK|nr:hemerythrin domain-containing protein [Aquabacterium terrae]NRF71440.1 hemerythrin [Aquabacterium terrae]
MSALVWTEALRVNQPQMDRTHQEFVELLADVSRALQEADGDAGHAAFERLLEHTVEHFGHEDRWMQATGFSPDNCHSRQHAMVLQTMRDVLRLAREGHPVPLGTVVPELGRWFFMHAQTMDAGLASHMAETGFDPVSGTVSGALPDTVLTHCGSAGCR